MRALSASALFFLLLVPVSPWAQEHNHNNDGSTQQLSVPQLSAANVPVMNFDSSSGSSFVEAASPAGSAGNAMASSSRLVSPMLAMVAPVPQPVPREKSNPWTAPFADRKFAAANSLMLFAWTADIEGTHYCLVKRTCVEGNHAIQGYPHPTRAQLYASTPWELPSVMASSYLSHVVLPRKWKWLSYLPPMIFGGMHAYYGEQGFKRGLFDARIPRSSTSPTR